MAHTFDAKAEPPPLAGVALLLAGLLLATSNFMVVLDMTIANVSVPNIAGGLAVSPNEGTWVITSYSVAEAIVVPLTGWLAGRFGTVRVFVVGMLGFGLFSFLCGLAPTLGWLVAFRVAQGLCGGPIMPMSQTLLMRIFPPKMRGQAMGLWAMTTVVAPIVGPILGGFLCDSIGWSWIFFINVPVALIAGAIAFRTLGSRDTPTQKRPVDLVGLGLLVTFVGALQIMLDKGKELDWFSSPFIVALALTAAAGFAAFLIWELTAADPIVNLRVFRHRGFVGAVLTISITFGAYFCSIVLVPLWLQTTMGYTATWAGYVICLGGVLAVIMSPIVGQMVGKVDSRKLVTFGVLWLAGAALLRSHSASNINYWSLAWPFLAQGIAIPFFFIPTNQLALSSVPPQEVAAAAGLSNFLRTTSAAFATSLVTTFWDNASTANHAQLAGRLNDAEGTMATLRAQGMTADQALGQLDQMTQGQAVMLATNQMFLITALLFVVAAATVWLVPKPGAAPAAAGGH